MKLIKSLKMYFEKTEVENLTVAQLQNLVLRERGTKLSDSAIKQIIEELQNPVQEMASPTVMRSPSRFGMASPDAEASVIREATISDSMTREEFLRRFDASVFSPTGRVEAERDEDQ